MSDDRKLSVGRLPEQIALIPVLRASEATSVVGFRLAFRRLHPRGRAFETHPAQKAPDRATIPGDSSPRPLAGKSHVTHKGSYHDVE